MDKMFGCKQGIGRCVLICREELCYVEDISEPIKFDEEEFKKFLTKFAIDIKK